MRCEDSWGTPLHNGDFVRILSGSLKGATLEVVGTTLTSVNVYVARGRNVSIPTRYVSLEPDGTRTESLLNEWELY